MARGATGRSGNRTNRPGNIVFGKKLNSADDARKAAHEKRRRFWAGWLRWMRRVLIALGVLLALFVVGFIVLSLIRYRYRDLAVYLAGGVFTVFCALLPIYIAASRTHAKNVPEPGRRTRDFLRGWLGTGLLAVLAWVFFAIVFLLNYSAETESYLRAGGNAIVFDEGSWISRKEVFYEYKNALWAGPKEP